MAVAAAVVASSAVLPATSVAPVVAAPGDASRAEAAVPTRAAAPSDVYGFVRGCFALRRANGAYVVKDPLGYAAVGATAGAAARFRFQATALGRYMLYDQDRTTLAAVPADLVVAAPRPGKSSDWRARLSRGRLTFTSVATGKGLGVGLLDRVTQTATPESFTPVAATGCKRFPEMTANATGAPRKGSSPDARVYGYLDDHIHISAFRFLGGRFHCGRPWSPYGVTVAMQDCADHQPNGAAAVFENFLANGSPVGTHDTEGWPSFEGWPRSESLTHEGTYWRWIERSWRGGVRIMVNDVVENRALCEIYPLKQNDCDEMVSARQQIDDMYDLQDYIDAQYGGPGRGFFRVVTSSTQARRVINDGKLAVVLGIEVSETLGCGQFRGTPMCDRATVSRELDDLHRRGVRSLFPVHKFDNALGGTHFDEGATGVLVNVGNRYVTGKFWSANQCPEAPDHDNEPTNPSPELTTALRALLDGTPAGPIVDGELPIYPAGPLCNPRGLTRLGAYTIRQMMARGMIVETDHLSVKARDTALSILEDANYSGLITSHSWGDLGSQRRLQRLGGVVGPMAKESTTFVDKWQTARSLRTPGRIFGIGFGSDINGLATQGAPRPGAATNPVRYPFTSFDGAVTLERQVSGTRTYDINVDGVDHYGLYPDWVEDLRVIAGDQIVRDLANGAEVYLQMWARAERHAA